MTCFLVTEHYAPQETSTAEYMTAIAEEIARDQPVIVISGTRGSSRPGASGVPRVIEIPTWKVPKRALMRRSLAMAWLCLAAFASIVRLSNRTTPVIVVTTPFLLPYAAVLAARLRGAPTALIVYDLYPEALIAAGLTRETSRLARLIRRLNRWLYARLDAVVVIGRDMERHVTGGDSGAAGKTVYIPNWATLQTGARAMNSGNRFRAGIEDRFVVGLSGNLCFTHDPETVHAAARALVNDPRIVFLLSGWGVGWDRLKRLHEAEALPNVRLIERVAEDQLDEFLAAADAWIIPYRKLMSGISVPSRMYNLLAIGRPIVALAEPDAEHARIVTDHDAGWVTPPEDSPALAETLRRAAADPSAAVEKGRRAVDLVAGRFTRAVGGAAYRKLATDLGRLNRP